MTAPRWSPQDERRLARIDKEIERYGFQGGDQSWLVTKLREARLEIERLTDNPRSCPESSLLAYGLHVLEEEGK